MNQETYEEIIREFDPEIKAVIYKILLVNFDVLNSFSPIEALREPIEEWLALRKKINRRGLGILINFRDPNHPIITTFVLTGNDQTDVCQSRETSSLDELPDEDLN